MAQQSRFFGSSGGDIRQYNQLEFAEVMERFVTNGVFPDSGNKLAVTEQTPALMGVKVDTGKAWIQGYYYSNTSALNVTLSASNATNPRIDLVILRLDVLSTRLVTVQVLTGTPAPVPVAPVLTQNTSIYEIALAQVLVPANSTSIVNANITASGVSPAVPRNIDQFGIGGIAKDVSGTDLNNLDATGFYQGTTLINAPSTLTSGYITHVKSSVNNIKQIFYSLTTDRIFTRRKQSGTWQAWVESQVSPLTNTDGTTISITGTDLNSLDITGFYRGSGLTNYPPQLAIGDGQVICMKVNATTRKQIFMTTDSNRTFTRFQISGVWQSWVEFELIDPPSFTNITLQNGAVVNNSRTPRYTKEGNTVSVMGEIQTVADGTIIGTLPAGFRPSFPLNIIVALANSVNSLSGLVSIGTNGTITVVTKETGSASPVCLNFSFVAEN